MARYAEGTKVSVEQSQQEIGTIVKRFKADSFISGNLDDTAFVMFRVDERFVRLTVPLPTDERTKRQIENEIRRRWRCLVLLIKAKLAAVDEGIQTFEEAFFADIVVDGNRTVFETARPALEETYRTGIVQPLLPPPR